MASKAENTKITLKNETKPSFPCIKVDATTKPTIASMYQRIKGFTRTKS